VSDVKVTLVMGLHRLATEAGVDVVAPSDYLLTVLTIGSRSGQILTGSRRQPH
jgi:hypothetical protein